MTENLDPKDPAAGSADLPEVAPVVGHAPLICPFQADMHGIPVACSGSVCACWRKYPPAVLHGAAVVDAPAGFCGVGGNPAMAELTEQIGAYMEMAAAVMTGRPPLQS